VTRAVVATVEGRVAASGAEYARRKPTREWAAYDFFLQGRELVNRYQPAEGEPLLTRAIELDPDYVHAHAWRAFALCDIYLHDERQETLDAAQVSAQRALALDEHDAWAHQAMGFVALRQMQLDLAGQHFDRAINLNPNDVNIACDRANWLAYVGRFEEGLSSLDLAQQRDPFPSNWISEVRGQILFCLKRFDEAIAAFRSVRPQYFWISGLLAAAYAHKGQMDDSHRELAVFRKAEPRETLGFIERVPIPEEMRNLWLSGLRKAGPPE
jgi:adenylate cyclase